MFSLVDSMWHWLSAQFVTERKFVIVGPRGAGKTSFTERLLKASGRPALEPQQVRPTGGLNFFELKLGAASCTFWDVVDAGREKRRQRWERFYSDVDGVVCVIDLSDSEQFSNSLDTVELVLEQWSVELSRRRFLEGASSPSTSAPAGRPLIILFNKCDLVSEEEGLTRIKECGERMTRYMKQTLVDPEPLKSDVATDSATTKPAATEPAPSESAAAPRMRAAPTGTAVTVVPSVEGFTISLLLDRDGSNAFYALQRLLRACSEDARRRGVASCTLRHLFDWKAQSTPNETGPANSQLAGADALELLRKGEGRAPEALAPKEAKLSTIGNDEERLKDSEEHNEEHNGELT